MALTSDQITAQNFADFYQMILPYLNGGGIGMKLLWENPDPTQSFAAGDVTLSSSDYDMLMVLPKLSTSGYLISPVVSTKGENGYISSSMSNGNAVSICRRAYTYVSDTKLTFGACTFHTNGSAPTTDNSRAIPYRIYGLKVYNRDVPGKTTLLWSNPNPTVNFTSQNITLDNSDYDYLHVIGRRYLDEALTIDCYIKKGFNGNLSCVQATSTGVKCESRYFTRTSDTVYAVDSCRVTSGSSSASVYDNGAIPLYIYGIKL